MDLYTRVLQLRNAALKKIEEAAQKGDTLTLFANTKTVEEVERIKKNLDKLINSIDQLEKNIVTNPTSTTEKKTEINPTSQREKGELQRIQLIQDLRTSGIILIQQKGSTYKTINQSLVGIAYASERRPNRWFLGLPQKVYYAIILLCEEKNGNLLKFVLPRNIYNGIEKHLSIVNGQLKFNVFENNNEYYMTIPNANHLILNSFLANYESLRKL